MGGKPRTLRERVSLFRENTNRPLRGTLLISMIGASWSYPNQCVETPHD